MLLIFCVFLAGIRIRAKSRLSAYRKELIARGEKLSIQELIPESPKGSNGAATLLRGAALLPTIATPATMKLISPGVARVGWKQAELPSDQTASDNFYSTNIWPILEEQISGHLEALADLRTAAAAPNLDFSISYSQGFAAVLPHLSKVKKAARDLSTAAFYELHRGNSHAAAENLEAGLLLTAHTHEPLMISQLVRFSMANILFNTTWEILQDDSISDEDLRRLQKAWEQIDFGSDAAKVPQMERAMGIKEMDDVSRAYMNLQLGDPAGAGSGNEMDELQELGRTMVNDPIQAIKNLGIRYPGYWFWCWCWRYDDERALMQYWQDMREGFKEAPDDSFFPVITQFDGVGWQFEGTSLYEHNRLRYLVTTTLVSGVSGFPKRVATSQTQKEMVVTAIALKRFHLARKKYPTRLDELVSEYIKQVPRDPFDGRPIRFDLKENDRYMLYSVGEDSVDNSGDPTSKQKTRTPKWMGGRDLVWPRSATAGEMIVFNEQEVVRKREFETNSFPIFQAVPAPSDGPPPTGR